MHNALCELGLRDAEHLALGRWDARLQWPRVLEARSLPAFSSLRLSDESGSLNSELRCRVQDSCPNSPPHAYKMAMCSL